MVNLEWDDFKAILDNGTAFREVSTNSKYNLHVYDGVSNFVCQIDRSPSDTTTLDDYEANYQSLKNQKALQKTSQNIDKVAIYEPEGFFKSIVSHNLCDRTTWYQDALQVTGEALTLASGTTYNMSEEFLIDSEHSKITGEKDYSLDFSTFQYTQTLRDKYKVRIYDNGVELTSGYSIDYEAGSVTLDSAPGGAVTADYWYENGSNFNLKAQMAGTMLKIRHVEIQFTSDIFMSPIIQSIKAYNPLDLPNKIEVEHIEFLNEYDVINIGNEGKGKINKYGNLPHDVYVFPFAYGRTIDLKSSQGTEINVSLIDDVPMTGTWATVTFYTTEEEEV